MPYPGIARATIRDQHRHGNFDPAIRWEWFAPHDIADKSRVVGNGMRHAGHASPACLILLSATDIFGWNADGLRQKVFYRFVALTVRRKPHEVLRVVGRHGLAAVIDNERWLIHREFSNAWSDSGSIQGQYSARR